MSERKTQDLGIKIVDRRGQGEPTVTYERFDNHKEYLSRMRELGRPPAGCYVDETTWSKVQIIPRSQQQSAFDD